MLMFWDVDPNISAFQVSSSFFSKLLSTCPRHAPASSSPSHQDLGTFHKKHCFKIINSIIIIETMPTIIIIDFITISIINHLSTISIPTAIINISIINTRPKPAYGRQGLAGLWGQDTDQGGTFWDVLNVSLRASAAQLGYKVTWIHKKTILES